MQRLNYYVAEARRLGLHLAGHAGVNATHRVSWLVRHLPGGYRLPTSPPAIAAWGNAPADPNSSSRQLSTPILLVAVGLLVWLAWPALGPAYHAATHAALAWANREAWSPSARATRITQLAALSPIHPLVVFFNYIFGGLHSAANAVQGYASQTPTLSHLPGVAK